MTDLDIRGDAPASPYTGVGGWETEAEQGVLIMAAQSLQVGLRVVLDSKKNYMPKILDASPTIVEIGSENGMSASLFRKFAPDAKLVCIEIDKEVNFLHNLKAVGLYDKEKISPMFGDSSKMKWDAMGVAHGFADKIDLLFIDGDHSFEGALADLRNFAPYVAEGGWLILHDCACATNRLPHAQHYTVSAALQHYMAEAGDSLGFKFLFSVDTMMVWKRFS